MRVCDAFPIAKPQGFTFALIQNLIDNLSRSAPQEFANRRLAGSQPRRIVHDFGDRLTVAFGDREKTIKILRRVRTPFDRKEIDNLNEKFRMTFAGCPDCFDKFLQPWKKTVVSDAQQGTAGNVPYAGCLDDQRSGTTLCKSSIPIKVVLGYKTIFSGSPWDHCWHPGATFESQWPDSHRL